MNSALNDMVSRIVSERRQVSEEIFSSYLNGNGSHLPLHIKDESRNELYEKSNSHSTLFLSFHTIAYFRLFELVASSDKPVFVIVNSSIIRKFSAVDIHYKRKMLFSERLTPSICRELANNSAHLFIMADVLVADSLRSHVPFMGRWLTYTITWAQILRRFSMSLCIISFLENAGGGAANCTYLDTEGLDIYDTVLDAFWIFEQHLSGHIEQWENLPIWEHLAEPVKDVSSGWNEDLRRELYRLGAWNRDFTAALKLIDDRIAVRKVG